ncbi:MAG: ABC transporter substrate-binding protein [Geminicoccaceae bacterium]
MVRNALAVIVRRSRLASLFAVMVLTALSSSWLSSNKVHAAATPEQTVDELHGLLVETMQNGGDLGFKGRFDKLKGALPAVFDFPTMARITIGTTNWRDLDQAQKETFVDRFSSLSAANYARNFRGPPDQTPLSEDAFKSGEAEDGPRGTQVVDTELLREGRDPVKLTYVLRPKEEEWRIVDVQLLGSISELARRRSEISATYRDHGFEGVIAALDKVIDSSE